MKKQYARGFLYFFALLAILPLFQQTFKPFKLAGLQGAFDKGHVPEFRLNSWFSGKYQEQADFFLKNNTAFNGDFVRLRNQLDYSVFGNINTILTLGKENYIFDPNYIYAREGSDFLNDSILSIKTNTIVNSVSLLDSLNIPLVFCIAPNKANYYTNYLPRISIPNVKTNQSYFTNIFQSNKVAVIDFDAWFNVLKENTNYPLIPKYGAHWSTYGAYLAGDSLLKSISELTGKKIPEMVLKNITVSSKPKFTDDDYLASLNLIKRWKSPEMAYPTLSFTQGDKPAALIISDSFIWNFYDLEMIQNCFSEKSVIRYYNKSEFDINKNNTGKVNENISLSTIATYDIVILISTGPSIKDIGFSFFDQLGSLKK